MKSATGNAIALVVVVALLVSLYAQWNVRSSLSRQLSELQDSVESLRDEVRELTATVGVVGQRPGGSSIPSAEGSAQPAVGEGASAGDEAPDNIRVELPTAGTGEYNEEPVDIVLAVASDGSLKLNGRAVSMDELEAELKRLLEARPAMHLILKAGESVAMDDVRACAEAAGRVGIHNLAIATSPTDETPEAGEKAGVIWTSAREFP